MTFEEMDARVAERLSEAASSPAFWTSENRRQALNEGYMEMADASEFFERTTPMQTLARQTYYDLRGFMFGSGAILTIRALFLPATNEWPKATQVRDLDGDQLGLQYAPRWENVGGTIRNFFLRGLYWLGVAPRPDDDGDLIRVKHSSLPDPMVEDDDEPQFPEVFHPGCVEYAVAELLFRDKEVGAGMAHWSNYKKVEKDLIAYVDQRQSIDRVIRMDEEWAQ